MLSHSLRKLLAVPEIRQIVVAINPSDQRFATLTEAANPRVRSITGGEQRQLSVLNALAALSDAQDSDWVLVHDAVRPCVQVSDIQNLIAVLAEHPVGGLLGAPLDNTIKQVDEEQRVTGTANRSLLWNALTPQMFRYRILVDALQQAVDASRPVTDEASAVELAGQQPLMVAGDKYNLKITHEGDLALAGFILGAEPGSAPAGDSGQAASTVRESGKNQEWSND